MEKEKILIINRNFEGTSVIYETDFYNDLKKYFNIFFYGEAQQNNIKNTSLISFVNDNNIEKVLCFHNNKKDYYKEFFLFKFDEKYIFLGDLHKNPLGSSNQKIKKNIEKYNIKKVFTRSYNDEINNNTSEKIVLFPWSLSEKTYSFEGKNKKFDICFLGASSQETYPLRNKVLNELKNNKKYKKYKKIFSSRSRNAKYNNNFQKQKDKSIVGIDYVEVLKKSKIMIFDFKYIQIPS